MDDLYRSNNADQPWNFYMPKNNLWNAYLLRLKHFRPFQEPYFKKWRMIKPVYFIQFHDHFLPTLLKKILIKISKAKLLRILKHYLHPVNLLLRMIMPTIPLLVIQPVLNPIQPLFPSILSWCHPSGRLLDYTIRSLLSSALQTYSISLYVTL